MNEQQQEKGLPLPHFSLGQKAALFGTAAPVTCVAAALVHAPPPLAIGGVVGAYILAQKSPQLYREVRKVLPFLPERSSVPSPRMAAATGEWSTWDRLMGRHLYDNVAPSAPKEAEREQPSSPDAGSYDWYDREDEDIAPSLNSSMFTFSQLLASGFIPSLHKIFLGRLSDGTDVFVEAKDLCHVALAGNTGNGKSSLLRLIMAQLCYIRINVVLLNPHYMLYDRDHDEDWTPYTPYLARNPMDYVTPGNIAFMLKWIIEKTLMRRMDLARQGQSVGKPYFIIIDELPAIVAERKEVAGYVAKLLREGRKYGIFLIVASQDFLVKTTGMDDAGGAVRKCFRTACYVGGDLTTANVLLEKQATSIPETELGKGKMMLRCSATKQAVLASVPYCDNDALYQLLGPSTFHFAETEAAPSISPSPATSDLSGDECERNGSTGETKGSEEGLPLRQFSELEMRVEELFIHKGMNPAAIVRELWPEIKGGDAYQKKSVEVADAIRAIYKAKTGGEK